VALPAPELWKADPLSREPRTDALTKELSALCNSAAVSSRSESCGVWAEMVHSVNVGRSVVQRGVRGFRHGVGRGTRSCVCVTGRCAGPRLRPPGRGADARMARRLARRASGADGDAARTAGWIRDAPAYTVHFYRAAATRIETGIRRARKRDRLATTAPAPRPGWRDRSRKAVAPSTPSTATTHHELHGTGGMRMRPTVSHHTRRPDP
jgi:hypothetical protein